jgi:GTP-binding protein
LEARFQQSVFVSGDLPQDNRIEVAVAGKSNVGKSSLLNKLVGVRGLAKTSSSPGKTRCLNSFLITPDTGAAFYLVDMPGYGYAKVSQKMRDDWAALIERYLDDSKRAAGIIALFDARREPTEQDTDWLAWLAEGSRPYLVVLTKTDKLSGNERGQSLRRWTRAVGNADAAPLMTSAVTGEGKDQIWGWINRVRRGRGAAVRA